MRMGQEMGAGVGKGMGMGIGMEAGRGKLYTDHCLVLIICSM